MVNKFIVNTLTCLAFLTMNSLAVPVTNASAQNIDNINRNNLKNIENVTVAEQVQPISGSNDSATETGELEAAATQNQAQTFVGTVGAIQMQENAAGVNHYDPSIYAGLITPEAFQQYVNQFGGAYAPLANGAAAYPAPAIYPYPGPYVVQTGYEGYLVPTTAVASADASTATTTHTATETSLFKRDSFVSNVFSALMMSTMFRVIAAVISAISVILFGSALASALCRLTFICDLPTKTITYLRSYGAKDVGRMLVDEITPERVRRATDFVRSAIRKYRDLQKLIDPNHQELN